jgi:RNA polymerase sigma-70 factor, ECF subfamily
MASATIPSVDVKHEYSFTELAHRIKAGDKTAEDILSRRISPGITQIVIRKTGNFALAQELCQETLIVVLTRLRAQPLDDPERLPAFAAQVARNLLMAERRKERRRRTDADSSAVDEAPDLSGGQEADAERESAAAAIRTVLQEMKSVRDRTLLVRYYLKDEDKKEICRELGLSEMSFNVILFRARNRFLELLARRGIRGGDLFCWAVL